MTTTMSITSLTTTCTTTMTTKIPTDIYQMCRLCLNTLKADEGESVFNNQVPSLPEKIYRVFGVQITYAKDLPNKLCSKCVQNTEQCYSHRETYKRQEHVLYGMIKKPAIGEAKNSPSSENVYSHANSNHSSSSCISSDPRYINANSSANNMDNGSNSPPYETNESLASHVEVIQGCDEMIAEVTIAYDLEETFSGDETICNDNNIEYEIYNDAENINVVKTQKYEDYGEEYTNSLYITKTDDGNENYEQQEGPKVITSVQFPMNPDGTTSELRPKVMQVGEWANNQGQSIAPMDPSDRMGMLLFDVPHIQSPGTPKGATVVRGKLESSEGKRKIYQTQATIRGYSDGHQVQHEVKDINASPNIHRKPTAMESSVQRMCSNCGTTCSTIWRRLNEGTVCNACGLYYKKYGTVRPPFMRRDIIHTRQRRKLSDNGMDISLKKKKIKIKKKQKKLN